MGEFRNTKLIDELVVDEKIAPIGFVKCKKDNKLQNPHVNEVLSLIISFPFVFLLQLIFDFHKIVRIPIWVSHFSLSCLKFTEKS